MSLAPLLSASLLIQLHAFAAIAAFLLGVIQLAGPKGTGRHRLLGYIWVALMLIVALSSFGVQQIRHGQGFSLIHLLSVYVLITLPLGILAARRHRVRRHRNAMIALFAGALVIAGGFTLFPGRIMHAVVFGE